MKTCNRKILELFYNANHSGRVAKPDAIGRVGEDSDGLVIEITWRVVDGVIEDAKFRAFGNPNAIATITYQRIGIHSIAQYTNVPASSKAEENT